MTATPTTPQEHIDRIIECLKDPRMASLTMELRFKIGESVAALDELLRDAPVQTAPQTPAPTGRAGPASTSEDADATRSPVGSPVTEPLASGATGATKP